MWKIQKALSRASFWFVCSELLEQRGGRGLPDLISCLVGVTSAVFVLGLNLQVFS